ncbi:MAG: LuxR C-terminal-related transcriptional regulator [Firmicutes bacterium]|nr:LuxR C-terminal-related transcriptional regulator [Bacillota bacterium]
MRRLAAGAAPGREESTARLTDMDVTLLRLIAEGKTNREIAEATRFTEKTIRNYVSALLSKLNLRNRAEAAAYAAAHNLLPQD